MPGAHVTRSCNHGPLDVLATCSDVGSALPAPATQAAKQKTVAERTVVMSARVEPAVRAGLEGVADATGLSMRALLSRAVDALRADPPVQEIAKARAAWHATLARLRPPHAR